MSKFISFLTNIGWEGGLLPLARHRHRHVALARKDHSRHVVLLHCLIQNQPFIVGMTSAVADKTAISFATGFYRTLGAGTDLETAFRMEINSVQLEGLNGSEIPKLYRV